jgi:lauroyl/myristoyl acyltransferase
MLKHFKYLLFFIAYGVRWKRKTIKNNFIHCGIPFKESLYAKLLFNMARDINQLLFNLKTPIVIKDQQTNDILNNWPNKTLLLSCHLGNHELFCQYLVNRDIPIKSTVLPIKNKYIYSHIKKIRKPFDFAIERPSPRTILKLINIYKTFAFMWDQEPRHKTPHINLAFFNRPCYWNKLPLWIINKNPDIKILIPTLIYKNGEYIAKLTLMEDNFPNNWIKQFETDIKSNLTFYYGWSHKRFKKIEPSLYN